MKQKKYITLIRPEKPLLDFRGLQGKHRKFLINLIDAGFDEPKFREILYDRSDYDPIATSIGKLLRRYNKGDIKKMNYAIRNLSRMINDEAFEIWADDLRRVRGGIKRTIKELSGKKSRAKSERQALGWKIVRLINLIEPTTERVNQKMGEIKYKKVDAYNFVARIWELTEGQSAARLQTHEVKKLYENNERITPKN